MKKSLLTLAIAGAFAVSFTAQAGTLTTANADITLSGGLAGGYVYNTDTSKDNITANDALIDLSSDDTKPVSFHLGIGELALAGIAFSGNEANSASSGASTAFQYGWASIMPTTGLRIDAGTLATNVGYEVAPSYSNGNILRGLIWNNQPLYYNGIRATYSMNNMSVYAEANKDPFGGGSCGASNAAHCSGSGVGASGSFGNVDAALNFFDVANAGSIVDIIASTKAGSATIAANIDYIQKAKIMKTTGTDDNAYGIALYASFPMGSMASIPMRLEYVNDGTSGLYGLGGANYKNTAVTFTITPTYNLSKSTFVRAEVAYVSTDKKVPQYVDDKGAMTDSNLSVGFQGGIMF